MLRDLAGSAYIRQEGKGLLIGPYETDCLETCWGKDAKGPPAGFGMELFGGELERITDNLMAAVIRATPAHCILWITALTLLLTSAVLMCRCYTNTLH